MANRRMIARNIRKSKKLAKLANDTHRLIWTWCLPFLDDLGYIEVDPELLPSDICPHLNHITPDIIEEALRDMVNVELIKVYLYKDTFIAYWNKYDDFQTFKKDRKRMTEFEDLETLGRLWNPVSALRELKLREVNLSKEKLSKEVPVLNETSFIKNEAMPESYPQPLGEKP